MNKLIVAVLATGGLLVNASAFGAFGDSDEGDSSAYEVLGGDTDPGGGSSPYEQYKQIAKIVVDARKQELSQYKPPTAQFNNGTDGNDAPQSAGDSTDSTW